MSRSELEHRDRAYQDDIRESCALIVEYVRRKAFPEFVASRSLQDAVIRRLAIIGEASKNLSQKTKDKYPDVVWKDMGRLRDLAVHHYWKLELNQIWEIAKKDVPALLRALSRHVS